MKRVLFLYEDIGYGHLSVAKDIESFIKNKGVKTKSLSLSRKNHPVIMGIMEKFYLGMVKTTPWMWKYFHQGKSSKTGVRTLHKTAYNLVRKEYESVINEFKPDTVVCSYAFSAGVMSTLKPKHKFKLVAISTDFFMHNYWMHENIDFYCVANDLSKKELIKRGIKKSKIQVTGIPVNKKYTTKQKFPKSKTPIILVMGGSLGLGNMKDAIISIDKIPREFQITVITGKNKKLYEDLKNALFSKKIKILGFINNVEEYLGKSTILIGKPGGLMLTGAIAKRIPFISYGAIQGQESKNDEFILKKKIGLVAKNKQDLSKKVEILLRNKKTLNRLKANMKKNNMDKALQKISKIIFS